jgi:hypothetical protein
MMSTLAIAATVSHDEKYKPKKTQWQVYYHDNHNNNGIQGEDEDQYDIDYPTRNHDHLLQ